MNKFRMYPELSYDGILQVDGAFSVAHINYGQSPRFNGVDAKNIAKESRRNSISSLEKVDNVFDCLQLFNGTEKDYSRNDQVLLWRLYWDEYMNVFDRLTELLPSSIVTIYIGRQAIEIGLKYLLLLKTGKISKTHDLGELSIELTKVYNPEDSRYAFLKWIDIFCLNYCKYIEGENPEYFRYPEYKNNAYFAGNRADIGWISYNFALILLKLAHLEKLQV